jgi:ferrous-iron efflux pump FieF
VRSTAFAAEGGRLAARAALAGISLAIVLVAAKGWAASSTGSTAMLGSLADTALDLVASLTTLVGVRIAALPADRNHRFGHGKAEALAAMAQVLLIVISAIAIGWRSVERLLAGAETSNMELGIGVSLLAMAGTIALLWYQARVIARTGSVAIRTDNLHFKSDLALNMAVIAALLLDQAAGISGADAAFGLAIALWLLWGAWRGASEAVDQLMDKEWPEEKRRRFVEVAARHPELKGLHDLRTRTSGSRDFVQFHVWVDPQMTVAEAHKVMDEVELKLHAEFPACEILIHLDPEGQVDQPGNPLAETDLTPGKGKAA